MNTYTMNETQMSGLTYDDVAELFSTSDYLLEVELSFNRNIPFVQRRQQIGDLQRCMDVLADVERQLRDTHYKNWAQQLRDKTQSCLCRIQSMVAFDEMIGTMKAGHRPTKPAA